VRPGRPGIWAMCSSSTDRARVASTGDSTPPTQWITRRMVTLRIRLGFVFAGGGSACAGGDAVADGDLFGADEDVFDQQPQHSLAVLDCGGGGAGAQLGQEAFQVVG